MQQEVTRRSALRGALGAVAGVLAGGLAGCGLETPGRSPATPRLSILADAAYAAAAEALAAAFASSPGAGPKPLVQVAVPSLAAAVRSMLAGASTPQPDLLFVTPAVREMADASSLLLNLAPALHASSIAAALYPSALAYGASGTRQLLIPAFRDPLVVYFNSDAFARAGVDPPAPDWTVERLMVLCAQLQQKAHGLEAPLANATGTFDLELLSAFVHGYGGTMLRAARAGYVPTFASAQGTYGFQNLAKLHPFEPATPSASPRDLFSTGRAALFFGHYSDAAPLATQISSLFAWGVAPLPLFPVRRAQPVVAPGLAAVAGTETRRVSAITLALFTASRAGQEALGGTGAGVPANRAVAASAGWRTAGPQLNDSVFVAHSSADFVVAPPLYDIADVLETALGDIVRGYPAYDALSLASVYSQYRLATYQG